MSPVAARSLDELLAGATDRAPLKTADSKSAATFETLRIGGEPFVLKVVDGSSDWLAIASHDSNARAVCLWEDGVYDDLPPSIDSAVVGAARLGGSQPWPAALLMRDVTPSLVGEDQPVDLATHAAFIDAMADLSAHFAGRLPATSYMPFVDNYRFLSPAEADRQLAQGTAGGPQPHIADGWRALAVQLPELAKALTPLLAAPEPLADTLLRMPTTFQHGDWKMGNLGRSADGRVVLLDWDRPQVGPWTADLAWYLAVNSDRLPESKDDTIARYRAALDRRRVETEDWWDKQLPLTLLGAFLMLGWAKAEQDAELAWWEPQVRTGLTLLES
ncbi:MAG: aminoglycoside phosphotransferase family protein [Frankiales bacterium]|nr:aminoglycoside phosphotransferase family protein [Frankiales bacterium]